VDLDGDWFFLLALFFVQDQRGLDHGPIDTFPACELVIEAVTGEPLGLEALLLLEEQALAPRILGAALASTLHSAAAMVVLHLQ